MRGFAHVGVLVGLAVTALAGTRGQVGDPAKVLAAAREALGGEKRLSAVTSFVATGRTRQVRGDNLVPIEFEIACELPDKYVRKDEIPAQESGPTATGFNGDALIQVPPASAPPGAGGGRPGGPPAPTEAQMAAARNARVAGVKQDFVRLTLGMFATSFSSYPVTFTYVGQAEAPQGKADVLDVKGASNFAVRLFVNRETHLPIMVSWQLPAPGGRGRGPGGEPPAGRGRGPGGEPPAAGGNPPAAAGRSEGGPPPPGANPPAAAGQPPARGANPPAAGRAAGGEPPTAGREGAPAGQPPAAGQPSGPPPPRESRIYFADYRDVNGMQFPFRLRRAVAGETVEETTFDGFKINAKIDPKKFEVPK